MIELADRLLPEVVSISVRAGCVLLLALCLLSVLRSTCARVRYRVLTAAVVMVLVLPLGAGVLPGWTWSALPARGSVAEPVREVVTGLVLERRDRPDLAGEAEGAAPLPSVAGAPGRAWSWQAALLLVWAGGVVAVLAWLVAGLIGARRLVRSREELVGPWRDEVDALSARLGVRRRVELGESELVGIPVTLGVRRPVILLPSGCASWSVSRRRIVLMHELVHVRRHDWVVQIASWVALAVHWFNPLAWVASRRLAVERERACDEAVIASGARPSEYAGHLLELARSAVGRRGGPVVALGMARPSQLEGRLMLMLNERTRRSWPLLPAALLVGAAGLALATVQGPTRLPTVTDGAVEMDEERLEELEERRHRIMRLMEELEHELHAIEREMQREMDEMDRRHRDDFWRERDGDRHDRRDDDRWHWEDEPEDLWHHDHEEHEDHWDEHEDHWDEDEDHDEWEHEDEPRDEWEDDHHPQRVLQMLEDDMASLIERLEHSDDLSDDQMRELRQRLREVEGEMERVREVLVHMLGEGARERRSERVSHIMRMIMEAHERGEPDLERLRRAEEELHEEQVRLDRMHVEMGQDATRRLHEGERHVVQLEERIRDLETQHVGLSEQFEEHEARGEHASAEEVKQYLALVRTQLAETSAQRQDLLVQLEDMRRQLDGAMRDEHDLRDQIEERRAMLEQLHADMEAQRRQMEHIDGRMDELQHELRRALAEDRWRVMEDLLGELELGGRDRERLTDVLESAVLGSGPYRVIEQRGDHLLVVTYPEETLHIIEEALEEAHDDHPFRLRERQFHRLEDIVHEYAERTEAFRYRLR